MNAGPFRRRLTMSASRIPSSPTSPTDTGRPGQPAKTVATRLSPEELQEVEAAAERDGKSLAERLRGLTLRSARGRAADPIELLLAELMYRTSIAMSMNFDTTWPLTFVFRF